MRHFLPNSGRILPALSFYGRIPLNVNAGRILPGFSRKRRIIEKLEYFNESYRKDQYVYVQNINRINFKKGK